MSHLIPVYVLAAPVEVQWDFLAALQHAVGQELGQYAVLAMDDEKVDKDPNGPIRGEITKSNTFKPPIRDETDCPGNCSFYFYFLFSNKIMQSHYTILLH